MSCRPSAPILLELCGEKRMATFPPEILLNVFTFLPLRSLLVVRGVNQCWRTLACTCAPHHSARRNLFELYQRIVRSPAFSSTRTDITPRLRPFDRQAWLYSLGMQLAQHQDKLQGRHDGDLTRHQPTLGVSARIPDEFAEWVLEWPERALTSWVWPGLSPCWWQSDADANGFPGLDDWRGFVQNRLASANPTIREYQVLTAGREGWMKKEMEDMEAENLENGRVVGLEVQTHGMGFATVLILDTAPAHTNLVGTVHAADCDVIRLHAHRELAGWLTWLRREFELVERKLATRQKSWMSLQIPHGRATPSANRY